MSTTIDNRVVQMSFDNKKFESGAEETLTMLDKLKRALNFSDAEKSFDNIENSANGLSFSRIENSLESLSDRFSGLGIVGMRIWEHIGDAAWDFATGALSKVTGIMDTVINQAKTGGWNRALNLEKASFMINNLGFAWDETSENYKEGMITVKKAVDDAVSGTAYSLDEAAVASSNFLAAGVKGGSELTETLQSVMGVASTYSKDFSTIARVWQNVAARGYVMYGDISDLQANGVAAGDVLMKYLGFDDASKLEDAYKDHLIDFDTFRDAFLDKFGDSLNKANDTYEGSLSNLKSAISRIGAEVATPLLENLIPVLNSLRVLANKIKSLLTDFGVYNFINNVLGSILQKFNSLIAYVDKTTDEFGNVKEELKVVPKLENALSNIADILMSITQIVDVVFSAIAKGFKAVFGKNESEDSVSFLQVFADAIGNIAQNYINFDKIAKASETFFTILKKIFDTAKIGIKYLSIFIKGIISLSVGLVKIIKNSGIFSIVFNSIINTFKNVKNTIINGFGIISNYFNEFKNKYLALASIFGEKSALVIVINNVFDSIRGVIQSVLDKFNELTGLDLQIPSLSEIRTNVIDTFTNLKEKAEEARESIVYAINHPKETLENAKEAISSAIEIILEKFGNLVETIDEKFGNFANWILNFKNNMTDAKDAVVDFADISEDNLEGASKSFSIFDTLKDGLEKLLGVLDTVKEFAISIGSGVFNIVGKIFENVKDTLGDMTWEDVFNIIKTVIAYVIAIDFDTLLTKLQYFTGNLNTIFAPMNTLTLKYKNTFRSIGAMILELGIAVYLIATSIGKIVEMDTDKAQKAVQIIAEVISVLTGAYVLMAKFMKSSTSLSESMDKAGKNDFIHKFTKTTSDYNNGAITGFGKAIVEMAAAIYIIAKAIGNLKDIDVEKLNPIMIAFGEGLAGLLVAIFGVGKAFKGISSEFIKNISVALIELSVAVWIISKAMANMGQLTSDQMNTAIIGFSAIMGFLIAFVAVNELLGKTKVGEKGPSWITLGISLMMLALAVDLILPAVFVLGKLDEKVFNQGILGLTLIMGLFMAFEFISILLGKLGGAKSAMMIIATVSAFAELAIAIDLLLPAIVVLGYMEPEKLVQGTVALLAIMAAFSLLAAVAGGKSSITGVASIIAITIAMSVMTDAISKLSLISTDKLLVVGALIAVLSGIFVVLAGITKAGKLGPSMFVMAESMLIFSVALIALAVALKMVSKIKGADLAKSLIAIGAAIAIFVGAAAVIKYLGLGLTIAELSVSLLAMGAATFLTAVGLTLFCGALIMLPHAIAAAIEGISSIFDAIGDLAYSLSDSIDDLKDSVEEIAKDIVELLLAIVKGALEGIEEELTDIINVVVDIIVDIFKALTDRLDDIVPAVFDFIVELINQVGIYLESHHEEILTAIQNLFAGVLQVALDIVEDFKGFGLDLVEGIYNGMCEFDWYKKMVDWVEEHIIAPICNFLGIHSPSTKMADKVGEPTADGIWEGFKNKAKEIYDNLIDWVADNVIAPIADAIKDKIKTVKEATEKVFNAIKSFFEDPLGTLKSLGEGLMNKLKTGITNKLSVVKNAAESVFKGIKT